MLTFNFSVIYASANNSDTVKVSNYTNNKSLKIILEYSNNNSSDIGNSNLQFRLLFMDPENDMLKRHIDYDFAIFKIDKEIYRYSNQSGQPLFPMHSSNGIAFIPISSEFEKGEYTVKVFVEGISFIPIPIEAAQFRIGIS